VLDRLHLIRHGEVFNPEHVCYADLPGFDLSPLGCRQAEDAAAYVAATAPEALLVTSPLDRALQTAEIVAGVLGVPAVADDRLVDWRLTSRWAGVVWEELPDRFPGELDAYLTHPHDLPFSPESIGEAAHRMAAAVDDLERDHPGSTAVVVSHQDPIQALRLRLTGRPLSGLAEAKPRHAEVVTLRRTRSGWVEEGRWAPEAAADPSGRPPEP
jgi:broad specificity phosphatase PhoE